MRFTASPSRAFVLAAAMLAAPFFAVTGSADASLHRPAPVFARTTLDGRHLNLTDFKHHVVLLTFWATWCAPCQIEMPHFVQWQKQYGPEGLQILAVSMDDEPGPVKTMVRRRNLNYPVMMGDPELGKLYGGILGLPVTFLIDREGRIAARFQGESDLRKMELTMRRLLQTK